MNKARKIYIDIIRIIGAFMVLYIHSSHSWYNETMPLFKRILYTLPDFIVSSAVPLFMMISGSLLLSREDSIKDIWNKKVTKIMLLIFILTVLHFMFDAFSGNADVSKFVYNLINLNDRITGMYWFIYWWLSFTIMLFCYQQIAKVLDKEHIIYLMIFCILFNIIFPFINLYLEKAGMETLKFSWSLNLPLFVSSGFFYPFLGYYLDNRCENNKILNNTLLLVFIIVICIVVEMIIHSTNFFTPIITVCIYQVIKNLFTNIAIKPNTKTYKLITFFGSNMIGVYAFQYLYGLTLRPIIRKFFIKIFTVQEVAVVLNFVLTFFILTIITAVLKKIPIFNKALN